MDKLLYREGGLEFWVSDTFDGAMLSPILRNTLAKVEEGRWDDYDEVHQCCRLIEAVRSDPGLHMEFHTARRGGKVAGIILVTTGDIDQPLFFPLHLLPKNAPEGMAVLNYFHIAPEERGFGRRWLRDVVLPRCRERGLRWVYVKSSHPRAFSLYRSLGEEVGAYTTQSDNGLYTREGLMFRLPLNK